jgi:hypothetical protein
MFTRKTESSNRDRDRERPLSFERLDLLDQCFRLVVVEEPDRDHGRVAILRDEAAAAVEVRLGSAESRDLAVVNEVAHERPETGRIDRVLLRADHDGVGHGRRRVARERGFQSVQGAQRFGVVRRVALGREAPGKEHDDHADRENDSGRPRTKDPPRVPRAGGGEGSGRERHERTSAYVSETPPHCSCR